MWVTLINLYLILYSLAFLVLLSFLLISKFSIFTSTTTIIQFFQWQQAYSKFYNLILSIFIILSGLPPVSFFYLKLLYLYYTLYYFNFFCTITILLSFFFSTLYYLQIFRYTNWTKKLANNIWITLKDCNRKNIKQVYSYAKQTILYANWSSYFHYNLTYLSILVLILLSYFFIFGLDIFYIFLNFTNFN